MAPLTDDGRHVVVNGRRWRATDPAIPQRLRAELVRALMDARRSVAGADGEVAVARARRRVHDAKVALGERGEPWWEPPTPHGAARRAGAAVRALLAARSADATICPSDAARVVGGDTWRSLLPVVRTVAADMASDGVVRITRGGVEVDPVAEIRGPVRIGRGAAWPDASTTRS